jgi:hypothetical protein
MIFPKEKIIEKSHIKDYEELYQKSIEHPEAFWENITKELAASFPLTVTI